MATDDPGGLPTLPWFVALKYQPADTSPHAPTARGMVNRIGSPHALSIGARRTEGSVPSGLIYNPSETVYGTWLIKLNVSQVMLGA
jgi:hypothetical protein